MQIVNQKVKLLNISHDNVWDIIEYSARNCFDTSMKSSINFIKGLINRNHMTPFEMVDIQVELLTNRAIMAELTRHRHAQFNVSSTRYIKYRNLTYIIPDELNNNSFKTHLEHVEILYKELLNEYGSDVAREVLPNCTSTNIIMSANLREWLHIFSVRLFNTTGKAHPLISELMKLTYLEICKAIPYFDYIAREYIGDAYYEL